MNNLINHSKRIVEERAWRHRALLIKSTVGNKCYAEEVTLELR